MMSGMLVAAALAVLAGLGAIAIGIPVKEFSFGNTMILSGTIGVCTGLILFGFSSVIAELKTISHRLRSRTATDADVRMLQLPAAADKSAPEPPPVFPAEDTLREGNPTRVRARMPDLPSPLTPPLRNFPSEPAAEEGGAEPTERSKRNLLFASTSRRERERAERRSAEAAASDFRPPPLGEPPPAPLDEPAAAEPAPRFEEGWPRPERTRAPEPLRPPFPRRLARAAPALAEPEPSPVAEPQARDVPAVSIIKSGVVDGMAYSLYSDGSIEAQMPEGMMRFASIGLMVSSARVATNASSLLMRSSD